MFYLKELSRKAERKKSNSTDDINKLEGNDETLGQPPYVEGCRPKYDCLSVIRSQPTH